MAGRNPFTVSQAELDSLKTSLEGLAAEYVAPLDALGLGLDRLSATFEGVNRSESETRAALHDLARLIEGVGLSDALRARQGHKFWEQMRDAAARIRAEPTIGSDPATKRHPSKFGREYAEAGYSLNHLLDAATWADAAATETHLAVLMSGRLACWELRDCGGALAGALRVRTSPHFAARFEALTGGNPAWPELREADPFGEPEKFALKDWQEWLMVRDAKRPVGVDERPPLGPLESVAAEPDAPEVPAAPTAPPDGPGFLHPEEYLPEGMNNTIADTWPIARRQLDAFCCSLDVANRKLSETGGRLPDGFADWWVRSWAAALMFRSHRPVEDAAGVRAWFDFGRTLDRALRISATPSASPHPYDAEFTYYDQPLLVDGGCGQRPLPFATHGLGGESHGRLRPVPFPRSPSPPPSLAPRLSCTEFRVWAGFLASPGPLTPQQVEELGHVGYSAAGWNGWCRVFGTHGDQCGALGVRLSNRLREAIRHASDALDIGVETIPQDGRLDEALDRALNWLAHARTAQAARSAPTRTAEINAGESNAMEAEQDPPPTPPRPLPVWDAETRTLTIGVWTKYAFPQAKNVIQVFNQFQRCAWSTPSVTPEVRADLDDLRKSLNDWLGENPPIRFSRDGTAKGIRWDIST